MRLRVTGLFTKHFCILTRRPYILLQKTGYTKTGRIESKRSAAVGYVQNIKLKLIGSVHTQPCTQAQVHQTWIHRYVCRCAEYTAIYLNAKYTVSCILNYNIHHCLFIFHTSFWKSTVILIINSILNINGINTYRFDIILQISQVFIFTGSTRNRLYSPALLWKRSVDMVNKTHLSAYTQTM